MNLLEANNHCSRNNNKNANKNLNSTRKYILNSKNDSCDDDSSDKDDGDDLLLKNDVKFVNNSFLTQSPNDNGRKGVRNALFSESCGLSPLHIPPVDNNGEFFFFLFFKTNFLMLTCLFNTKINKNGNCTARALIVIALVFSIFASQSEFLLGDFSIFLLWIFFF